MTAATCVRCGRPMPDTAYVCQADALSLAESLEVAAGHAEDAEAVIARQARYGGGGRGSSGEPLPVDLTASARYAAVGNTVTTWARHVVEETGQEVPRWRPLTGPPCPAGWCEHETCRVMRTGRPASAVGLAAGWLATQTGWLRNREEAGEAFKELHNACEQLARLVDRPPDKDLVGMCDCGKVLYAPPGQSFVTCPVKTCAQIWHVERSREILRRALDGKLVTAAEAARLGAYLDTDRNQEQIRALINKWAERKLLEAHGHVVEDDGVGEDGMPRTKTVPTYRFGDVSGRLARTPRRTAKDRPWLQHVQRILKEAGL